MTSADPVTVVATFRVAPGRDADFELWAHEITVAAAEFPGHLGASWVRSKGRYQVIYRFADPSLFSDWHESDVRAEFLKKLAPLATLVTDDHLTGLETWFELPNDPGRPAPPRWKMVVVTWIGVFPLLGLLQWQIAPRLGNIALLPRVMVIALVVVATMTYLVMPRLTILLRRWLYPA
ncbi:MAG: antibiotic biosynthesis monooxygenase [Chloroflexi bacterium]|nr:MAG: antibiotic biosynthesis monooxygenase [Chloroflexota bacterium]